MTQQAETPSRRARAVYRLYGDGGTLLYIGSTRDTDRRWAQHRVSKDWWSSVVRREVVWYSNVYEAYRDEARAILRERPRHNVASTAEDNARRSARQQANAETQRIKCRVAAQANQLRHRIARELMAEGVSSARATGMGMLAERAYKEESGAFPNGVSYPTPEHIAARLAE